MAVTMLLTLVLWPFRATVSLALFVIKGILSLILLPFKVAACIFRTGKKKVQAAVEWTEDKIRILRRRKPFVYILPLPVQQEDVDEPGRRERASTQKSESINSIIQDLERLSKYESPVLSKKRKDGAKITQLTRQIKSIDKKSEEEKCQLLKLIHELQELAYSETSPASNDAHASGGDDEVSELLADLNVLETYLTDFLHEQDPLKQSLIASSLETILEEDTSQETSPSYPGSPLLRSPPNQLHSTNEVRKRHLPTSTEGAGTTDSDGSVPSVNRESDMESLINSLEQQQKFMQTQLDLQNVMDSLSVHTNIDVTPTSAKSSPAMPKSMPSPATPTNKPVHAMPTNKPAHATSNPTHATPINKPTRVTPINPDTEEIYDSLTPIYSVPLKKTKDQEAKAAQNTPPKTPDAPPKTPDAPPKTQEATTHSSSVSPNQDDIYDKIPADKTLPTTGETPPPVPIRQSSIDGTTRTGSDGTSSNEYSPNTERRSRKRDTCSCRRCEDEERRHRHHSDGDDRCYHDDDYHRRRHSDGEYRRRHRKHKHHCRHCDHSPDCCSHRTRSRERKSSHRHRHRSPSDESRDGYERRGDYDHQGRIPESSGYESQESPRYSRKGSFSEGEQSAPPTPPKDGRRGLFGLFSKRTGSISSLASTKSEL